MLIQLCMVDRAEYDAIHSGGKRLSANYINIQFNTPSGCPIARLSDDILYEIFSLLVDDPYSGLRPPSRRAITEGTSWLACTYVCRYWRRFALSSPHLWATVHIDADCSMTMLREFLARSRDAPIDVILQGPLKTEHPGAYTDLAYAAGMVSICARRLKSFFVLKLPPEQTNRILEAFWRPAPRLQNLTVCAEPSIISSHTLSLTPIFGGRMPSLRSLMIVPFSTPWLPYQNLTQILLLNQPAPSLAELLWTLHQCPLLDTLGLGLTGSVFQPDPPALAHETKDHSTIHFRHMRNLIALGRYDVVAPIISRICVPTTACRVLSFHERPGPGRRVYSEYTIASDVRLLVVTTSRSHEGEGVKIHNGCIPYKPVFSAEWLWNEKVASDQCRLGYIGDVIRYPAAEHLIIGEMVWPLHKRDWVHVLDEVPTLTHLEFRTAGGNGIPLFGALIVSSTDGGLICPGLARFSIPDAMDLPEDELRAVLDCFTIRQECGASLAHFEIKVKQTREEFSPEMLERLAVHEFADVAVVHFHVEPDPEPQAASGEVLEDEAPQEGQLGEALQQAEQAVEQALQQAAAEDMQVEGIPLVPLPAMEQGLEQAPAPQEQDEENAPAPEAMDVDDT